MATLIAYACSLLACATTVVSDVRARKIPNEIPLALALFGLTFNVLGGWRFALSAVVAGIVVFVLGSIPFSMGIIGGGDVKLLAACACVFGLAQILPLVLYTALIGGAVGVVALLLRRLGRIDKAARLPYAVAITGGVAWLELSLTLLPKLKLV